MHFAGVSFVIFALFITAQAVPTKGGSVDIHSKNKHQTLTFINYRHFVNTLRPRQNGRHFADDMFKCIFFNANVWIPIEISLKFVPNGSINNNPALFAGNVPGYLRSQVLIFHWNGTYKEYGHYILKLITYFRFSDHAFLIDKGVDCQQFLNGILLNFINQAVNEKHSILFNGTCMFQFLLSTIRVKSFGLMMKSMLDSVGHVDYFERM